MASGTLALGLSALLVIPSWGAELARDSALLQVQGAARGGARPPPPPKPGMDSPRQGIVRVEHKLLGCFKRSATDVDDEYVYQDKSCIEASRFNHSSPCRSGLPFFRLRLGREQSYLDCFTFCASKGLDVFGMLSASGEGGGEQECRCGATPANRVAWHMRPAPASLLPSEELKVPEDEAQCQVLVWQYTGGFENDGMPTPLVELTNADVEYLDEIAESMPHVHLEDEPGEEPDLPAVVVPTTNVSLSLLSAKGLCENSSPTGLLDGSGRDLPCEQAKAWCNETHNGIGAYVKRACPVACGKCSSKGGWLPCYPDACGPGGGPWLGKENDVVTINYFFEGDVDDNRRAAFRQATTYYKDTCLRFRESRQTPRIRVAIVDEGSCSAGVGYPGEGGTNTVNLGWCKDSRHIGSMVHELGHAVGMNHEQNRPDAAKRFQTPAGWKGPYLRVKWNNIDEDWKPQYRGDPKSYIGSSSLRLQQPATLGYSDYDYLSIMHYSEGNAFETVDVAKRGLPGARSQLSRGDIQQIRDMYQCKEQTSAPTAAPTPAPTPAPTTPPPTAAPTAAPTSAPTSAPTLAPTSPRRGTVDCQDDVTYQDPWGNGCEAWARWQKRGEHRCEWYPEEAPDLRARCPRACAACKPERLPPKPSSSCRDTNAEPYGYDCNQWAEWVGDGAVSCVDYGKVLTDKCQRACNLC